LRSSIARGRADIAGLIALSTAPVAAQQIILAAVPQDESVKPGEKNLAPEQKMPPPAAGSDRLRLPIDLKSLNKLAAGDAGPSNRRH
jgi:hypothetical protein